MWLFVYLSKKTQKKKLKKNSAIKSKLIYDYVSWSRDDEKIRKKIKKN